MRNILEYFWIILAASSVVKIVRGGVFNAVGFETIGNYHIIDKHNQKTPDEKHYFLSKTFKSNWMGAQSFCRSFGMDLVAIESKHEAEYFFKACNRNIKHFGELSHIGGVLNATNGKENWFWITTHQKVNLGLAFNNKPAQNSENNCLQLVKGKFEFSLGRTNCFGSEQQEFVCQRKIIKSRKEDSIWEWLS